MKYTIASSVLFAASFARAQQPLYAQCGGIGWTGGTTCVSGSTCTVGNPYYSQCLPGGPTATSVKPTTTTTPGTPTATGALPFLGGVNLAGFDFGSQINGSWTGGVNGGYAPPVGQISHFASQGVNLFRIPFAWQLATPTLGGNLDSTFFSRLDTIVQAALAASTKPWVILDVHNYARWEGGIINQGGPTNEQFASLWSQLAAKYKNQPKIMFGLMNEPHDIPSVSAWKAPVQAAVNAIRAAGATTQYILIPGSSWSSAEAFPTEGGPVLLSVTDPSGGTSKLIFDVHKYLDSDNSGTHSDCVKDNVSILQTLNAYLKANGNRQALLTETGGGATQSCYTYFKQQLAYIKANPSNLAGYAVWSAGSFDTKYTLTVTPNADGSDQPLWINAVKPNLP